MVVPKILGRTADFTLDRLLGGLPAVAIEGPKGVGKTFTARRRSRSFFDLSDPTTAELVGADPARMLGADVAALLEGRARGPAVPRDGTLLGGLFESLVTLGVRVAAEAGGARVRHLRTERGEREVDLVVVRDDQRIVAIEVKLTQTVDDGDVRHLRWLRDTIGDDRSTRSS